MTTPLSRTSGRVKAARKLLRRTPRAEVRLFLAEGENALRSALTVPDLVVEVFATCAATTRHPDLYADTVDVGAPWHLADDAALDSLSDAVTSQGLVAVCRFVDRPLDEVVAATLAPGSFLAICAEVRDPGNAGSIIRTADAAGAAGVVLAGNSVDAYNPKTVRATAGSLFHLPLCLAPRVDDVVAAVRRADMVVLAADGAGEADLYDLGELLARPVGWLFGNEAHGLPGEVARLADHRVRIPIHGRAESLKPLHGGRRVPLRQRPGAALGPLSAPSISGRPVSLTVARPGLGFDVTHPHDCSERTSASSVSVLTTMSGGAPSASKTPWVRSTQAARRPAASAPMSSNGFEDTRHTASEGRCSSSAA